MVVYKCFRGDLQLQKEGFNNTRDKRAKGLFNLEDSSRKADDSNNKLSIITICYNEPDLEKTCKSIVNQTFQDFEWIVVDGGSDKETQDIWDKYKYRIDKFISEPDNGIYNAMNKGIALAEGEYLNFLNAGDYYYNSDVLMDVISNNLDKDILYGNLKLINNDGTDEILIPPDIVDNNLLILKTLPHPSSFIKNELFKQYGGYSENYKIVSDWEKWIEFIKVNKCSYKHLDIICAVFNLNGISYANIELCNQERNEVINKYFTKKEIKNAYKSCKIRIKYKFSEQIFSIKNDFDKRHKIITIIGIHIKIKR